MEEMVEKLKAVMLGHAVGDALGVPVEFCTREALDSDPVTDMRGFGTHSVPAGAWSDDTSMSLAALDALCEGEVDYDAIMQNFVRWHLDAKYTSTDSVFDVGRCCSCAVINYFAATDGVSGAMERSRAFDFGFEGEGSNGNGSLMRIHPFVLYAHARQLPFVTWRELIDNGSRLTHAHERSRVGCLIYAFVLMHLLNEPRKDTIDLALRRAECEMCDHPELAHYKRIFDPGFAKIPRSDIKSSGYVVDTLEAALWCLLTTDSYRECVLKAVNLGADTDTVAAVAGGVAGALYGYEAIPQEWLGTLLRRDDITALCTHAAGCWMGFADRS